MFVSTIHHRLRKPNLRWILLEELCLQILQRVPLVRPPSANSDVEYNAFDSTLCFYLGPLRRINPSS